MSKRRKFIHHGHAILDRMEPVDLMRFLAFVKVDDNGCWIWHGAKDPKGYPNFKLNGRRYWAHRLSYANFRTKIRGGNDIHHLRRCKSASCVNPAHLAQRTRLWNSADGGRRRHVVEEPPF